MINEQTYTIDFKQQARTNNPIPFKELCLSIDYLLLSFNSVTEIFLDITFWIPSTTDTVFIFAKLLLIEMVFLPRTDWNSSGATWSSSSSDEKAATSRKSSSSISESSYLSGNSSTSISPRAFDVLNFNLPLFVCALSFKSLWSSGATG